MSEVQCCHGVRLRQVESGGWEFRVKQHYFAVIELSGRYRIVRTDRKQNALLERRKKKDERTHRSWSAMKERCQDVRHSHYNKYGGRGIVICQRWESYENFVEDMGIRPDGMSLDRIDVNGNYEPGNCRWATAKEQNRNKTNGVVLTHNNKSQSVTEWAEELGISRMLIYDRLLHGWSAERALTTPKKSRRHSAA